MTAWKIYVSVFSVIILLSGFGRFFLKLKHPDKVSTIDLVEGLVGMLMIPALLGFGYHRALGPHILWMVAVPILTALSLYQLFAPKNKVLSAKIGRTKFAALMIVQVLLGGPALYAIIRYAYFSPRLWA